jgi:hypothetical protein
MKKIKITLFTLGLASLFMLGSCNKKNTVAPSSPAKQNDQAGSAEADGAIQDVNDMINNQMGGGSTMKVAAYNLPCGVVTFDSTKNANNKYTYNLKYGSQTPCGFKYKSGQVSFTLTNGTTFKDVGAVFTITFTNYKVTSNLDKSTITLNGTLNVTNVNGGYIYQAATSGATIIHKLRGTFNITYSNNATRSRTYAQKRTWTSSNGWAGLSLTVAGDSLINANTVSETGYTYEGNYYFQTEISTDFNWSNCGSTWAGPYVLKAGHAKLNVAVPNISNTYIDVEAGYYWNLSNLSSTPTLVNDCTSNAYKVNTVIGSINTTVYQPY